MMRQYDVVLMMKAVADRMIPKNKWPSATEAGFLVYLEYYAVQDDVVLTNVIEPGLGALHMGDRASATPHQLCGEGWAAGLRALRSMRRIRLSDEQQEWRAQYDAGKSLRAGALLEEQAERWLWAAGAREVWRTGIGGVNPVLTIFTLAFRTVDQLFVCMDGICFPNGFHLNGDYRKRGITAFHYRPFTLVTIVIRSATRDS